MVSLRWQVVMRRTAQLPASVRVSKSPSAGLRAWLAGLIDAVLKWRYRQRQRYSLQTLDDHLLKDIGFTRADVHREATKRFWQS